MDVQVAARFQLAVLGDYDIPFSYIVPVLFQRYYSNISVQGLCLAVHGDFAVRHKQVDIILCQNSISIVCFHFANLDLALCNPYSHASFRRGNGSLNRYVTCLNGNRNVAGSLHLAGSVIFAYRHIARAHGHGYILAGSYVFAYGNVTLAGGHGNGSFVGGNGIANVNIALLRLHGHVLVHGDVGCHSNASFAPCLHVQAPACGHVVRYQKIAVGHDQSSILRRGYSTILTKNDIPSFRA